MRHLLNTLYVSTEGAYVRKDGENAVVEIDGQEKLRAPLHLLGGVVCFGRANMSPALMGACAERGVTAAFFTENGKFLARVEGPVSGNVLLRREQYRRGDAPQECGAIVSAVVAAKAQNQRTVLKRAIRDHGDRLDAGDLAQLDAAQTRLRDIARKAVHLSDTDHLRGLEGEAAQRYFDVFHLLQRTEETALLFTHRSRRPPLDPINALLSFLYTLLTHDCRSALEGVGLDPAAGFLHRLRPGRPSLALDLMEELRAPMADRLALSLTNRGQIRARDFRAMENGATVMTDIARKAVLVAWQERKKQEIEHPFLGEKAPLGLLPHLQARLLARTLRGDLDFYPPMIWR
jgi:CRISPR-associated protein Cas1